MQLQVETSDIEFIETAEGYDAYSEIQGNRILLGQIVRGSWLPLETFSMSKADLLKIAEGMGPLGFRASGTEE